MDENKTLFDPKHPKAVSPLRIQKVKISKSQTEKVNGLECSGESSWKLTSVPKEERRTSLRIQINKNINKHALRQQAKRRRKNTNMVTASVKPQTELEETESPVLYRTPTMTEVLSSIPGFSIKPRKRSTKKLSAAAQIAQANREGSLDLETPDSFLSSSNLRSLLNKHTFHSLPPLYQYKLLQLLPHSDRIPCQTENMIKLSSSALNNEFFARACMEWTARLADGEFTPENQARIKTEIEKEKSKLDPWKLKNFEPIWGEKNLQEWPSIPESSENTCEKQIPIQTTKKLIIETKAPNINKSGNNNRHNIVNSNSCRVAKKRETKTNQAVKRPPPPAIGVRLSKRIRIQQETMRINAEKEKALQIKETEVHSSMINQKLQVEENEVIDETVIDASTDIESIEKQTESTEFVITDPYVDQTEDNIVYATTEGEVMEDIQIGEEVEKENIIEEKEGELILTMDDDDEIEETVIEEVEMKSTADYESNCDTNTSNNDGNENNMTNEEVIINEDVQLLESNSASQINFNSEIDIESNQITSISEDSRSNSITYDDNQIIETNEINCNSDDNQSNFVNEDNEISYDELNNININEINETMCNTDEYEVEFEESADEVKDVVKEIEFTNDDIIIGEESSTSSFQENFKNDKIENTTTGSNKFSVATHENNEEINSMDISEAEEYEEVDETELNFNQEISENEKINENIDVCNDITNDHEDNVENNCENKEELSDDQSDIADTCENDENNDINNEEEEEETMNSTEYLSENLADREEESSNQSKIDDIDEQRDYLSGSCMAEDETTVETDSSENNWKKDLKQLGNDNDNDNTLEDDKMELNDLMDNEEITNDTNPNNSRFEVDVEDVQSNFEEVEDQNDGSNGQSIDSNSGTEKLNLQPAINVSDAQTTDLTQIDSNISTDDGMELENKREKSIKECQNSNNNVIVIDDDEDESVVNQNKAEVVNKEQSVLTHPTVIPVHLNQYGRTNLINNEMNVWINADNACSAIIGNEVSTLDEEWEIVPIDPNGGTTVDSSELISNSSSSNTIVNLSSNANVINQQTVLSDSLNKEEAAMLAAAWDAVNSSTTEKIFQEIQQQQPILLNQTPSSCPSNEVRVIPCREELEVRIEETTRGTDQWGRDKEPQLKLELAVTLTPEITTDTQITSTSENRQVSVIPPTTFVCIPSPSTSMTPTLPPPRPRLSIPPPTSALPYLSLTTGAPTTVRAIPNKTVSKVGSRVGRGVSNRPPPGAVNLERSYQICQAVIQNSPNREILQNQLRPPPGLVLKQQSTTKKNRSTPPVRASSAPPPPIYQQNTSQHIPRQQLNNISNCACSRKAMIPCRGCGNFCHDGHISASRLCVTCDSRNPGFTTC